MVHFEDTTFCLLEVSPEENKRRRTSFALGFVADLAAFGMILLVSAVFPYRIQPPAKHYALITLNFPVLPKPTLPAPRLPMARATVAKIDPPAEMARPVLPAPRSEPSKVEEPQLQANLPTSHLSPPLETTSAAVPEPLLASPPLPSVRPARTGLFDQLTQNSKVEKISLRNVQTGGFGSPEGLPGQATAAGAGNVPKLGGFDLPEGPGVGNGTGGLQGKQGIVASAGFGDGGVGRGLGAGSEGGRGGAVKTGAFRSSPETTERPKNQYPAERPKPQIQTVEILSKPSPEYTEEARRLRVQGEVVLSVIFQSNGTLKIMGIVKSLGYGLDEMAERAASQIRFKPAQQGGRPTDFPATLHIEFRLA